MQSPNKQKVFEITAAIFTGIGKFVFMDWLNWRLAFITCACFCWAIYVWYRYREDRTVLDYWGLSKANFGSTFKELFPIAVALVVGFILLGNYLGTNMLNWNILPVLLLYPLWGVIQQFLVVGLLAKNLETLDKPKIPRIGILLITATIFSVIHYPWALLMVATFFLAIVYTSLYLNRKNLIVLGIFHGWLGGFFFYTLMERDPWLEIFAAF